MTTTYLLTWADDEPWGSLLSVAPDGQRLWWGFVRLDDVLLASLETRVDTVLGPDGLRRITWTSSIPAAAVPGRVA